MTCVGLLREYFPYRPCVLHSVNRTSANFQVRTGLCGPQENDRESKLVDRHVDRDVVGSFMRAGGGQAVRKSPGPRVVFIFTVFTDHGPGRVGPGY